MTLQQIESEIAKLAPGELNQLLYWLDEYTEKEKPLADTDWTKFVQKYSGSMASSPIERQPQGYLTERDEIL